MKRGTSYTWNRCLETITLEVGIRRESISAVLVLWSEVNDSTHSIAHTCQLNMQCLHLCFYIIKVIWGDLGNYPASIKSFISYSSFFSITANVV